VIVEAGHFLLILAFALSLYQAVVPLAGVFYHDQRLAAMARPVAALIFILVALSFLTLVYAYIISDFSVLNVVQNSHSEKPLLFKITGVWGNHEGSMMLWVLILTFFSALVAVFSRNLPANFTTLVLVCQSFIASAFLGFILFTSNPFQRLDPPALQGNDLNPVLQDIGLALHPPVLYLGYVGFSVCFSFAIAALLSGRIDAVFGRWVRLWALISWIFLTGGIITGSYWAYYELGWGGYWFWDPVENASLMPWLAGTALLHSALVLEKLAALKIWTVLLAIITFSLSLLGTFLVRSGILTSVHSFAVDSRRGIAILFILVFFIGSALLLFAFRAPSIRNSGLFRPVSREGALVFNNLFLTTAAATVLVGTLYPLVLETLTGVKISVGAPFFNLTFGPLVVPLLVAVPFGPLLAWKRGDIAAAAERLWLSFALALTVLAFVLYLTEGKMIPAVAGLGLSFWVIAGALTDIFVKAGVARTSFSVCWRRLRQLPGVFWGTAFAHMGLGITLFGILAVALFGEERIANLRPGEAVAIAGRQIYLEGYEFYNGPNYRENRLHFTVADHERRIGHVMAAKRVFPSQAMQTTEAGLLWHGLSQYYIAPGDYTDKNGVVVHVWWKPWVLCIWLGGFFMMAGGIVSLGSQHLRVCGPNVRRRVLKQEMQGKAG